MKEEEGASENNNEAMMYLFKPHPA